MASLPKYHHAAASFRTMVLRLAGQDLPDHRPLAKFSTLGNFDNGQMLSHRPVRITASNQSEKGDSLGRQRVVGRMYSEIGRHPGVDMFLAPDDRPDGIDKFAPYRALQQVGLGTRPIALAASCSVS